MSFLFPLFLSLLLSTDAATTATSLARCTTRTSTRTYEKCMPLPTQDASIAWTYHPPNATLDLAFSGVFISPSGWVAWGINPDSPSMTGARALVAFSDPATGRLLILPFVLDPSVKLQRSPLASRPLDIPLLSSSAVLRAAGGGGVSAGATVEIQASLRLKLNGTTIHHVWNRGLYVQGKSPTIHPTSVADLASRATFDVVTSAATLAPHGVPAWVKPAHAVLNTVSWGILIPVGVAVARYLRQIESIGPTWFYAHATIQATGFLLGTAGFSLGLVLGRASPDVTYGLHRGLGIAAFAAASLQSLALFFRPKTTHKFRKYWKSYHHFVGYGCAVVGVVNVFEGMEVMGLGRSYEELGYCLALSTLLGVSVALEGNAWVASCRRAEEERVREGMMMDGGIRGGRKVSSSGGSGSSTREPPF